MHCWKYEATWLFERSLGRQCGGSQEHFWVLILFGFCLIFWMSRKQKSVAISTAKTKYIATSMTLCEAGWLRKLFSELFVQMMDTTVIFCANQGGFDCWGIPYSMISPVYRHHILPYLGYGTSMSEDALLHWYFCIGRRHSIKAPGKGQICDFLEQLGVIERPSYEGPAWCMHWALEALRGLGYLLEQQATIGWLTLP